MSKKTKTLQQTLRRLRAFRLPLPTELFTFPLGLALSCVYPPFVAWGSVVVCFILCILLIRALGYTFPLQDTLLTTLGLGFIYSATCQAIATAQEEKKWIKVLSYLGRISLPIYFIHYFFLPDLAFLRSYEETLSSTPIAQFAFQAILGLATSGIILIPTLLLISITRTNKYLRFLLYGEPLS